MEYKREVAAWFRDSIERPDDALLVYAVTTDEWETIREAARLERVKAAERVVLSRAKRQMTKRKAPAPDAGALVVNLTADEAAHRVRARRRARAQHDAKAPIAGDTKLLLADETAIPSPTGAGQAG